VSGGLKAQKQIAQFTLQFYTSPDFDPRYATSLSAGTGYITVARWDSLNQNLVPYTTMAAMYQAEVVAPGLPAEPFNYILHSVGILKVAVRYNLPGAQTAYDWLRTVQTRPTDGIAAADYIAASRPGLDIDVQ
jgi:hypothetical protein